MDDVLDEADLALADAARGPVEHRHHDREILPLFLVRLREVLLRYPAGPLDAELEGPRWVAHVGALDQHPPHQDLVVLVVVGRLLAGVHVRAEHAHKLGQVLKVARHLRGQDHVDDDGPGQLVRLPVEVLEDVDLVVAWKETIIKSHC